MSDYPAGWYDDPKTEGQERYWDGTGWTHDVRQSFPPGWYADPDRFGAERYWDGGAWTDDRRFVTRLDDLYTAPTLRKKEFRLVVAGDRLSWNEESIAWDDIIGFDSVVTMNNGRPVSYRVTASAADHRLIIDLPADKPKESRVADAFAIVIDQAQRVVTPRILKDLFARADAGEVVEYEKVTLSPRGFAKGGKDPVAWGDYAGWRANGAFLNIDRLKGGKTKKGVIVQTTQLGRWVLTALIDDYARRYPAAQQSP